jgi:hypothetical protein
MPPHSLITIDSTLMRVMVITKLLVPVIGSLQQLQILNQVTVRIITWLADASLALCLHHGQNVAERKFLCRRSFDHDGLKSSSDLKPRDPPRCSQGDAE